jgi:integrase
MNSTFPFTQNRIDNLSAEDTTKTYSDQKLKNLKITVTAQGAKTYYCRFKVSGVSHNIKLGNALSIILDDAKARAIQLMNYHRQPALRSEAMIKASFQKISLNQVFKLYKDGELAHRVTVAGRAHSMEVAYNKHIKQSFGKELMCNISKKSARNFFKELEAKGYGVHNKCLSTLKAAVNYVIDYEEELSIIVNPFERIKKMPGVSRNRYLTHQEASQLLHALDGVDNQDVADIFRVALFTGARLSNVKQMKWLDLNLNSSIWLIPASRTKTRKHYEIPLHSMVIELLSKRSRNSDNSEYVFASSRSKYGFITGGDPVWKEAIKAAGLYHENPNIRPRPHDLRRTFATWQIQSGADISVVSKALCHTSLKHTLVYAHTNVDQVRSSIEGAFKWM